MVANLLGIGLRLAELLRELRPDGRDMAGVADCGRAVGGLAGLQPSRSFTVPYQKIALPSEVGMPCQGKASSVVPVPFSSPPYPVQSGVAAAATLAAGRARDRGVVPPRSPPGTTSRLRHHEVRGRPSPGLPSARCRRRSQPWRLRPSSPGPVHVAMELLRKPGIPAQAEKSVEDGLGVRDPAGQLGAGDPLLRTRPGRRDRRGLLAKPGLTFDRGRRIHADEKRAEPSGLDSGGHLPWDGGAASTRGATR